MNNQEDLFAYNENFDSLNALDSIRWEPGRRPALERPSFREPMDFCGSRQRLPEPDMLQCSCARSQSRRDPCRPQPACPTPASWRDQQCFPNIQWHPVCTPACNCKPACRPQWKKTNCRNECCCPCPPPCPQPMALWVRKVDMETETGLPGAVFSLRGADGNLQVETSREDGWMCFLVQPGTRYVLAEITAPPGYESQLEPLEVWIDFNGRTWVNGLLVEPFIIPNQRMAQDG